MITKFRVCCLFIVSLVLFYFAPPALAADNLITNPSVENGSPSMPDSWSREKRGNNVSSFNYTRIGNGDSRSVGINVNQYSTGYSTWFFNPVPVVSGKTYIYRATYKADIMTDLVVRIYTSDSNYSDQILTTLPVNPSWSEVTYEYTVPADVTKLTFMHVIRGLGSLDTDQFSLVTVGGSTDNSSEGSTPTTPDNGNSGSSDNASQAASSNLIKNPSVESGGKTKPTNWSHQKRGNNLSLFKYTRTGSDGIRAVGIDVTKYVSGFSGWYFDSVPVTSGKEYSYSEQYKSSVQTQLVLRSYDSLGKNTDTVLSSLAASNQWETVNVAFTPPANAVSVTIIHKIDSLGSLESDNFVMTETGSNSSSGGSETPPQPTPTPSTNLIPNPSLETVSPLDSTLPQYWSKSKFGVNDAKFSYLNTGNTGNRSLRIDITNYTGGVAYYEFAPQAIEGGKVYEYSVRYKADVYAEVDAAFTMADGSVTYQYLGVSYPSATAWSTFRTRIVAPDNAVKVTLYNMLYSTGFLVTDDYSLTQAVIAPLQKPIVTLTFDDAFTNFYDNALPLFEKYNMAGTIYLVSQDFQNPEYMSPAQLNDLEKHGFEMGSHTVTHPHLPLLSSNELAYELNESKRVIEEKLGHSISSFATPYGEYNDTVLTEIMKVYKSHRSVDVGYNSADNYTKSNIRAMSAVVSTSPEEVLAWVDSAIANKAWLSVVYHDIVDGGGQYTNTSAHLEAVLAGLKARGVSVMTTREAVNYIDSTL